jgi:hypothetical protein
MVEKGNRSEFESGRKMKNHQPRLRVVAWALHLGYWAVRRHFPRTDWNP